MSTLENAESVEPSPSLSHSDAEVSSEQADRYARQLTRYLDAEALQEVQDGFTAVTGMQAIIVDTDGKPITQPSSEARLARRDRAIRHTLITDPSDALGSRFEVPIRVGDRTLGAIVLTGSVADATPTTRVADELAGRFGVPPERRGEFAEAIASIAAGRSVQAVRFAHQLASVIAEVCRQDIAVRQRAEELTTLYSLSTLLAGQREIDQVLRTVVESAAQVLDAKAASIRLLTADGRELVPTAVHGLSQAYLDKGPVLMERAEIDRAALDGEVVYVADMASDPRVIYPDQAKREGLASILCAGMTYRGEKVGVMRVYSAEPRRFTDFDRHLLQALGQAAAAAIRNVRLDAERSEARRVRRQVELAAQVQRRLMPSEPPDFPPFDVAARYVPSFELGGDFYDYISLEHSLAIMVGDVVGKGVPASLLMATVRAALRAHAEDTYDLDEVMAKVNSGLTRDTTEGEFVTAFYGTIDAHSKRLTYCSAGHDPALLCRDGRFTELTDGGTVLGIDRQAEFDKGLVDLKPGDVLFVYSDGLPDAMNFDGEKFGRERVRQAILARADAPARDIVNHVLWEARRFIGLNAQSDDITLLAVKINDDEMPSI